MPERRHEFVGVLKELGLPEPDEATMTGLRDIVDEGVLGASNHVALALALVARAARADRPTARQEALELAGFIARTRGVGAPIVANALAWQIAGAEALPRCEAVELLRTRAEAWSSSATDRRRLLIAKGVEALARLRAPLIFDYSSTVADLVRALVDETGLDRIVIPESRAIDGGRRYMNALADLGLPIMFLPDAALDYAVSRSDAVLLGAESVTLDGGILNTVGSILAARAARARDIPVYAAADLFKAGDLNTADLPAPALRSYDFLLDAREDAATEAPELEIVPPALITSILTEVGPVKPRDLASALAQRTA